MADSKSNRPIRTLSDIRPPSQATTAPVSAPKKSGKKATPDKPSVAPSPIGESTTAVTKKSGRSIWKVVLTSVIIVALIAGVAGIYYYVFSS